MFINYSNHPSKFWSPEQAKEASKYGEIVDVAFPKVPVDYDKEEVLKLAEKELNGIKKLLESEGDHAVMCQGEYTLTVALVNFLQKHMPEVKVVSAVSERIVLEKYVDGKTVKEAEYRFCGFREYI